MVVRIVGRRMYLWRPLLSAVFGGAVGKDSPNQLARTSEQLVRFRVKSVREIEVIRHAANLGNGFPVASSVFGRKIAL
jgi:hypothetical protein